MNQALPNYALASAAETALVALAMTGDEPAFAELVRRRQGMIRGLMRQLCGDSSLADDFAQEAFFKAWQKLSSLRSPGAFGGWLRRIAVNVFLQHARRKSYGREHPSDEPDREEPVAATSGRTSNGNGASLRMDLEKALARLKPVERTCVVLSYRERMSHGEISESTGLPLGTVKSHIVRGSSRLREYLKDYEGDIR